MFQIVRLLLPSILITVCFATLFASGLAQLEVLPADEVQALSAIFNTLGKKNWDSSINPCNDSVLNFDDVEDQTSPLVHVNCRNCVVNGNESYRVVGIFLKGQNVSGTLPSDLVKLRCLEDFDLGRNYLHGPIPSEWGSMQHLVNISLFGNRITGSIPGALANIKTLKSLIVDINQLYGNLPPELGNMSSLKTLSLSSNSFTGELPSSFANLSSLQNFRISDNLFSGQIPSYIQNWKNLTILYIQSSGLRGPIPSLDPLKNLSDLRISDVNGSSVTFPLPIINVPQWETLILRNCNLTGPLPDKIFLPPGGDTDFTVLYLSGNLFTGPIPNWMLNGSGKMMSHLLELEVERGSSVWHFTLAGVERMSSAL